MRLNSNLNGSSLSMTDNNPLTISEEPLRAIATPLEHTTFGAGVVSRIADAFAKEVDRQMLELLTQGDIAGKKTEI